PAPAPHPLSLHDALPISSAYTLRTLGLSPAAIVAHVGPLDIRAEQLLGAGYILLVGTVNFFGIHRGAVLQNVSTAFKVGALGLLDRKSTRLNSSHRTISY